MEPCGRVTPKRNLAISKDSFTTGRIEPNFHWKDIGNIRK